MTWTEEKHHKGVVPKPKLSNIQLICLPWVPSLPEWKVVKQSVLEWCTVNQGALTHFQVGVLLLKVSVHICVFCICVLSSVIYWSYLNTLSESWLNELACFYDSHNMSSYNMALLLSSFFFWHAVFIYSYWNVIPPTVIWWFWFV